MKWIQLGDWSNIGDGDERNRMVLKSQAYMIKWIVMPFTEKKKRGGGLDLEREIMRLGLLWELEVCLGILNDINEAISYASLELREDVWDGDIGLRVSGLKWNWKYVCTWDHPLEECTQIKCRRVMTN